jgi:hypothetical protein
MKRHDDVLPSVETCFQNERTDAHDRDLGRVDDRREIDAADAAQGSRIVKLPPCIWSGFNFPSRASFARSPISLRDLDDTFLVASRITGTTKSLAACPRRTRCDSTY